MTKKFRVSVIVVYTPVEPTDGDTSDSDEFYLQLQEQIDRVPGRNDGVKRERVGLMMNKEAAKSCLGWKGINNRILIAHFMTKKSRVSVIVVYAPVGPTDRDTSDSDEFYSQLQEQIDWVPGRNIMFY